MLDLTKVLIECFLGLVYAYVSCTVSFIIVNQWPAHILKNMHICPSTIVKLHPFSNYTVHVFCCIACTGSFHDCPTYCVYQFWDIRLLYNGAIEEVIHFSYMRNLYNWNQSSLLSSVLNSSIKGKLYQTFVSMLTVFPWLLGILEKTVPLNSSRSNSCLELTVHAPPNIPHMVM